MKETTGFTLTMLALKECKTEELDIVENIVHIYFLNFLCFGDNTCIVLLEYH